jgi:hypothetical protein
MEDARLPRGVAPISCRPQQGARDQGWRTDPQWAACGRRAPDQADLVLGRRRRRTRQHGPSGHGRRGSASIRPAGPAPGTRAESADTKLTARPAARGRPLGTAAWSALSLTIFRLPLFGSGVRGGLWHVRGPARFTRGKAKLTMTFLVSRCSTRQLRRTLPRSVGRKLRPANAPAASTEPVAAGQRRNVPAGVNRG